MRWVKNNVSVRISSTVEDCVKITQFTSCLNDIFVEIHIIKKDYPSKIQSGISRTFVL